MSRQQDYYSEVFSTAREMGFNETQAHMAATQASLETGYGKSVKGNNHFGIKSGKSWSGPTVNFATKEEVNGKLVGQRDSFRGYQDMRDSIRDYGTFMSVAFPETWEAPDFNTAVKGLNNGKYGAYATDSKYGGKLGYINDRFGGGVPQVGPSQALQDFTAQGQQLDPLAVDTSFAGMFGMDAMPGIDGLSVNQTGVTTPAGKPEAPEMPSIGPLSDKMGSYEAPVSTVGGLMEVLGAPESVSQQGASVGIAPDGYGNVGLGATSVANSPSRDAVIDGYSQYAASRMGAPAQAMTGGVPQGRFDQAFDVFSAPSVAPSTTAGLPSLGAAMDISARPEVMGPSFNFDNVSATPSAKPDKDEGKGKGGFGKFDPDDPNEMGALGKAAFAAGLMSNPAMAIGGLALSNAMNGRALNAGMGLGLGNAIGGFGGLGGLGGGMGPGTPGYESWASGTPEGMGYASVMNGGDFWDGFTSFGGNLGTGRDSARAMAAEQAARSAMGLSTWGDAVSRDWGGLGIGGGNASTGGLGGLGGLADAIGGMFGGGDSDFESAAATAGGAAGL
ncbi:glucosaminidase domain-containing protein [Roseibium alexandrii]